MPGIPAHIRQRVLCLPAQQRCALFGIGIAGSDITGAAVRNDIGNCHTVDLDKGIDHIQHRVAGTGAQIKHLAAVMCSSIGHGCHMALAQIHHMDVVPDTGAVVGVVIVAVNAEELPSAYGDLRDIRHQIIGNTPGILTDAAALMGTDGIEVAQQHHAPLGIGMGNTAQDLLGHVLGPAIGIGAAAGAAVFPQGHFVIRRVDRCRRGEDQPLDICLLHHLGQDQGGIEVIVIIFPGLCHRFAHCLEACKVDHCVDGIFREDLLQQRLITDIALIELQALARQLHNTVQAFRIGIAQIVDDHHTVSAFQQLQAGVRSDITGTAGNKHIHGKFLLCLIAPS